MDLPYERISTNFNRNCEPVIWYAVSISAEAFSKSTYRPVCSLYCIIFAGNRHSRSPGPARRRASRNKDAKLKLKARQIGSLGCHTFFYQPWPALSCFLCSCRAFALRRQSKSVGKARTVMDCTGGVSSCHTLTQIRRGHVRKDVVS